MYDVNDPRLPDGDILLGTGNGLLARISADNLRVKQQCQVLGGVTSVALTQAPFQSHSVKLALQMNGFQKLFPFIQELYSLDLYILFFVSYARMGTISSVAPRCPTSIGPARLRKSA